MHLHSTFILYNKMRACSCTSLPPTKYKPKPVHIGTSFIHYVFYFDLWASFCFCKLATVYFLSSGIIRVSSDHLW